MRLKELAERSGVSVASIKYYRREGLLPPARRLNPTLAEYGPEHLARLRLVTALRGIVGVGIDRIRDLARRIDDPATPTLAVLEHAQTLGLGAAAGAPDPAAAGPPAPEDPVLAATLREREWPDTDSRARDAVAAQLRRMRGLGLEVPPHLVRTYADAADRAAAAEVDLLPDAASRDDAARIVAVGVHEYTRLLTSLVALAQASRSIRRYGDGAPAAPDGSEA